MSEHYVDDIWRYIAIALAVVIVLAVVVGLWWVYSHPQYGKVLCETGVEYEQTSQYLVMEEVSEILRGDAAFTVLRPCWCPTGTSIRYTYIDDEAHIMNEEEYTSARRRYICE